MYKSIKLKLYEVFGEKANLYLVVMTSTVLSELFCLGVYYPFDLIKCRLQSKNAEFKYENLPHALSKEIKNNGISSLY
jgi:hypothetical protein